MDQTIPVDINGARLNVGDTVFFCNYEGDVSSADRPMIIIGFHLEGGRFVAEFDEQECNYNEEWCHFIKLLKKKKSLITLIK